jgi:DNA-directed RNA polymerase specialized sigma24 family protein
MRRAGPTAFVRRHVALDELYKIARAISRRVSRDEDYRGDLMQEGVLKAVKAQDKKPDLTQAVLSTVILRGMLERLRADRLDNRRPSYRGRTIFIADAFNEDNEPGEYDKNIEALENKMETDRLIAEMRRLATPLESLIIETILAEDCTVVAASQRYGLSESTGWTRIRHLRERVSMMSVLVNK